MFLHISRALWKTEGDCSARVIGFNLDPEDKRACPGLLPTLDWAGCVVFGVGFCCSSPIGCAGNAHQLRAFSPPPMPAHIDVALCAGVASSLT